MIRALIVALALCAPAYAEAPGPYVVVDCGTLAGAGRVTFVVGGVGFTSAITCGVIPA